VLLAASLTARCLSGKEGSIWWYFKAFCRIFGSPVKIRVGNPGILTELSATLSELRASDSSVGLYYLSKLRRDSVGADFQSVRKLTNYVCVKPPESRLSVTSEAQTKKLIADIGISTPSTKLI